MYSWQLVLRICWLGSICCICCIFVGSVSSILSCLNDQWQWAFIGIVVYWLHQKLADNMTWLVITGSSQLEQWVEYYFFCNVIKKKIAGWLVSNPICPLVSNNTKHINSSSVVYVLSLMMSSHKYCSNTSLVLL